MPKGYVCRNIQLQPTYGEWAVGAWFSIIDSPGIRCADHKLMSKQWAYHTILCIRSTESLWVSDASTSRVDSPSFRPSAIGFGFCMKAVFIFEVAITNDIASVNALHFLRSYHTDLPQGFWICSFLCLNGARVALQFVEPADVENKAHVSCPHISS
jgi:hypothetical protein